MIYKNTYGIMDRNNIVRYLLLALFIVCGTLAQAIERADSIQTFLLEFGEREPYVSQIVEHCEEYTYDSVYYIYVKEQNVLHFDKIQNKMCNTIPSIESDSHPMYYKSSYIRNNMYTDIKGDLISLFTIMLMQGTPHDSIIQYSKFYWYVHHIPCALTNHLRSWTEWKYTYNEIDHSYNVDNRPRKEAIYLYYCMASYVLLQGRNYKDFFRYKGLGIKKIYRKRYYTGEMIPYDREWIDNFTNNHRPISDISAYNNYDKFRAIHLYDNDKVPFSLSETDKQFIQETLDMGIAAKERECIITKAFALITGTLLDRNLEEGKELLISIWPQMRTSCFWSIIEDEFGK